LSSSDRVLPLVLEAAEDFIKSVGITDMSRLDADSPVAFDKDSDVLSSMLGFSGSKIKAALVVESTHGGIAATNPQREYKTDLDLTDHTDWIGEIANQIVGNLKRIFRSYGVDFTMGTPVVMTGRNVHILSNSHVYRALVFALNKHHMKISISVQLADDVNLESRNEELKDEVSGGDAFLF
jgi:CheY-specific phosphatase CheX